MTDEPIVSFFVAGEPEQKGSTRAFIVKGRPIITTSNKNLKQWELRIAQQAQEKIPQGFCDGESAYNIQLEFAMPVPKNLPKSFIYEDTKRPDLDKLVRACLDGLTGIAWLDDSQVVDIFARKRYVTHPYLINLYNKFGVGVSIFIEKHPGRVPK
jgi:crossover junction endodeoxyribonuclease RusA